MRHCKQASATQKQQQVSNNDQVDRGNTFIGFATVPYIRGVSDKVKRILQDHNVKVAFKPAQKLGDVMLKTKDGIPVEKQTGVIYFIPCADCDVHYVGETGRAFQTRIKEHMSSVRLRKAQTSALAEQSTKHGHDIDWKNTKIVIKKSK